MKTKEKYEVKIKVIKKNKVITSEKPVVIAKEELKAQATKNMVSTVSDWVKDRQKSRNEESKRSFERLFSRSPQEVC